MFKNSYQSGLLSIFYSCGSHPLALWEMEVNNGHIKRLTDNEVNSIVLEIVSTNVATTYITCPPNNQYLGIKLPFLVMIVKNLKRYFSFEITILDDKNMRRRFRISNFQSTTKIKPFCTTMPIGLSGGWNQIQFNLSDFTRRAYGSQFIETLRVQVHANVRLRRIYFAERLYTEEELPQDYKLYLPLEKKGKKKKGEPALAEAVPAEGAPEAPPSEAPPEGPPPAPEPRKSTVESRKSTVEARKSTVESRKSTVEARKSTVEARKSTVEPRKSTARKSTMESKKSSAAPTPAETAEEGATEEGETPSEAPPETPEGEAPAEGEVPAEAAPPEGEAPPEAEPTPEGEAPPAAVAAPEAEAPAEAPPEEAPAE